jgi:hypothetical protein
MSEDTIEPIEEEIQPDPYEEKFISKEIIKFCCICGAEFGKTGKTNTYFGCQGCGTALKVILLDSDKYE